MRKRISPVIEVTALVLLAASCTGVIGGEKRIAGRGAGGASGAIATGGGAGTGAGPGTGGGPGTAGGAGTGGGPGTGGSNGTMPPPDSSGNLPYTAAPPVGAAIPARVWQLTRLEFQRSVKDFLGVDTDVSGFDPEFDEGVYANLSNTSVVRVTLASQYADFAEKTAAALTDPQLRTLTGACANVAASCKADFLRTALTRAFRRPAATDEIAEFGQIFDVGAGTSDAALPFRSVVQAILTSPFFLYRTEIGAATAAPTANRVLTGSEVASLLSYSLLGQPPSATLLEAALRGELTNVAMLKSNVERLIADPSAAEQLTGFTVQWLSLRDFLNADKVLKFETAFPGFQTVRASMLDEARSFLANSGGMNGTLAGLLTNIVPASGGALGAFYASDASSAAGGVRTGILGLGAVLAKQAHADQSSPTLRGNFVREHLLCQHITLPPNVPDLSEAERRAQPKSTRELYELHAAEPACAACHKQLDGIGFAFENFDGAGRYRTKEIFRGRTEAVAIDATGKLVSTDVNRDLGSHTDLAQALSTSDWVRECMAINAFRYYFGYGGDVPRGLPPVIAGYQALARGGRIQDLIVSIMSSATTLERTTN